MSEKVDVVQLGAKQVAITFNKYALAGLKDGRGVAVDLNLKGDTFRVLLMRDTEFTAKMSTFKKYAESEMMKQKSGFFSKIWAYIRRNKSNGQ